jgi:hypothetical protein
LRWHAFLRDASEPPTLAALSGAPAAIQADGLQMEDDTYPKMCILASRISIEASRSVI